MWLGQETGAAGMAAQVSAMLALAVAVALEVMRPQGQAPRAVLVV
jgi:hypothetical protein